MIRSLLESYRKHVFDKRLATVRPIIEAAFIARDLPTAWGMAFAMQESAFKASATNLTDPGDVARGGSFGLFQMSYKTALTECGYHGPATGLLDPQVNAALAAKFISILQKRHYVNGPNDLENIASGYNSGKPRDKAPPSTRDVYVTNVILFAGEFGWTG